MGVQRIATEQSTGVWNRRNYDYRVWFIFESDFACSIFIATMSGILPQ